VLDERACRFNLTNERGVDGTIRLLRNVMGLWLVQECRRQWEATGEADDYDELHALAAMRQPTSPDVLQQIPKTTASGNDMLSQLT
jgi:rhamnulokinase